MRFSSVDALFEARPRRCLPSNLSQLGIGRRANKKPRHIVGRGLRRIGHQASLYALLL